MNKIRTIITLAFVMAASVFVSCEKVEADPVVYLEVNANNISGQWELVEWNGAALSVDTYIYLDIVRNTRTFTMYQNVDSFDNVPHIVTGSYSLDTDPELGAIILGKYDYDSGDWNHKYIIKNLTATEMTWVAKDDASFVQKFNRVDSIPVKKD